MTTRARSPQVAETVRVAALYEGVLASTPLSRNFRDLINVGNNVVTNQDSVTRMVVRFCEESPRLCIGGLDIFSSAIHIFFELNSTYFCRVGIKNLILNYFHRKKKLS